MSELLVVDIVLQYSLYEDSDSCRYWTNLGNLLLHTFVPENEGDVRKSGRILYVLELRNTI